MNTPCHNRDSSLVKTTVKVLSWIAGVITLATLAFILSIMLSGCTTNPKTLPKQQNKMSQKVVMPSMITNYISFAWFISGSTTNTTFATGLVEVFNGEQKELCSMQVPNPKSPTAQWFTNIVATTNNTIFVRAWSR